jgi:hypothetical protein
MLRELSHEEMLARQKENFNNLKQGSLFNLGGKRNFLVKEMLPNNELEVVELTRENCLRIISGQPCDSSRLAYKELLGINLCS